MSKNSNLHAAKASANNELYTSMSDIIAELSHYKDQFKGKKVYCNCDCAESNFVKYFRDNYDAHGLAGFEFSGYGREGSAVPNDPCGGYDYPENVRKAEQCDIIVTNPPFSKFRDYFRHLIDAGAKFLIVAPLNAIKYEIVWPYIKHGGVFTGFTQPMNFIQPDGAEKMVRCVWLTNIKTANDKPAFEPTARYYGNEHLYPRYDNYDAINVDKLADIPCDYCGVMGVPITILEKNISGYFEIVGVSYGYGNADVPKTELYGSLQVSPQVSPWLKGKVLYTRVFIQMII